MGNCICVREEKRKKYNNHMHTKQAEETSKHSWLKSLVSLKSYSL